ncbi:hypothetical protein GCM10011379_01480 [Filimonas zeae]|uniref:Uncharacterized protein n=2 Tax=Filimonas zeae TaxID=1737353 RepID=A0A917IMM0_9BACT|nr:hypothetical protein GCM10011379_01480 [Filimonas zeae]
MLQEILETFSWPASYLLIDDLPSMIIMRFPHCDFTFEVGFEGKLEFSIWPEQSDTNRFKREDALIALREMGDEKGIIFPFLQPYSAEKPSPEKMRHKIRNVCVIMQTYFLPSIGGDFSWISRYFEIRNRISGF